MKKRRITVAILMIAVLLIGCAGKSTEGIDKLVFTYVQSPLNVPSIVEKEMGMFQEEFAEEGIDVEYVDITSGAEQTQALAAGEVDFLNAVGAASVVLSAAAGNDIKIIGGYSRSPKVYCIVTMDETIQTAEDLVGKVVGGPKGTTLNELLIAWLKDSSLTMDDVDYLTLSVSDAYTALMSGNIDAAMIAGPTAYKAVQEGATVLTTGEGYIDGTVLLATSGEICEKYPEYIEKYIQVQKEILKYIEENHADAVEMTAKAVDLPADAVEVMLRDYDFFVNLEEKDIQSVENTMQFLLDNGMIEEPVDVKALIYE